MSVNVCIVMFVCVGSFSHCTSAMRSLCGCGHCPLSCMQALDCPVSVGQLKSEQCVSVATVAIGSDSVAKTVAFPITRSVVCAIYILCNWIFTSNSVLCS